MFDAAPVTVLVTIPTEDRDFEAYVRETYVSGATPASLEALIRARHPQAVVRARLLSGERFTVWYVYRDGGWRPHQSEPTDRPGPRTEDPRWPSSTRRPATG